VLALTAGSLYLLLIDWGERVERIPLWFIAVSGLALLGLLAVALLAATAFRRREE
jgi:hypothetical protein